jgi:hypothetical protein
MKGYETAKFKKSSFATRRPKLSSLAAGPSETTRAPSNSEKKDVRSEVKR